LSRHRKATGGDRGDDRETGDKRSRIIEDLKTTVEKE